MQHSHAACGGGGGRRAFLKAAAMTGAAVAGAGRLRAEEAPESPVPLVTLGKTGQKVTRLGMGTSWALSPSFVQSALFAGVRYIDTSENYENTLAERVIGQVLARTGLRKDVYLVSKNGSYRRAAGGDTRRILTDPLNASLERLQTDYLDAYYIHGITGGQIGMLKDPAVKAAFEGMKQEGKIRFTGLSCHDALLPEIIETAAEVGWIDQIMIKYNFRDVGGKDRSEDLQRAIDRATQANLGLVAMKTQGGAGNFPDRMAALQEKGFKKEVAAIKTVWMDERMHVAVSEMTTRSDLRENVEASGQELTVKEARLLEDYRRATARLYCHGCAQHCEPHAGGLPVAEVMRYLRYHEVYGKRRQARALYQTLPESVRLRARLDLQRAEEACPHGLSVASLMAEADRLLS